MTDCKKKYINIIRGDSTGWNGINFFKIHIDSRIDLYGFNAKFILGGNTFTFNNLYQDLEVELTSQQTQSLPLGVNYGTLYIFDESKKRKTITTSIPFNVKEWVDGDIAVDDYTFSVNITEGDETILSLNIETAVSVEVGTTTTLPAGSEATVTNSGTQNHLVLDFGIPEGEKGEKGETGEDGQDATINGVTALSIITDDGISSNMSGNTFVISGTEILDSISAEASTRENQIASIVEKIPEQASSTNKLADKDFVISSLQTFSAHFRGSWATWANVPTNPQDYPADDDGNRTPTIHDYLIIVADENHNGSTWRYTYTGEWQVSGKSGWKAEYEIKDTPFTSEQLAAINSGATRENISQISTLQTTKQDRLSTQQLQNIANVPNKMEVTDIIAGDNITVQVSGRTVKINSTGGGSGGASSFSELNGSPYDNTALATALNSKADESEIDEINQEIATISQSLANKAEVSDLNQTNENLSALTGDVENVSAEVMAQGEAIQNLEADKADKSTTYTKLETNNLLDAKANQSDLDTTTEIAKGAQKGVSFTNYYNAVQNINSYEYDKYIIGQSVYIITREVPDLWVSAKYETSVPYVYTTDDAIVEALKTSGVIRFGRYQLSPLETGKVDLTGYVKNTDYATSTTGGVVKVNAAGLAMYQGQIRIQGASNIEIFGKQQAYNPITPSTLDYAVKVGVVSNTQSMSEQEQTAARTWIGATLVNVIEDD